MYKAINENIIVQEEQQTTTESGIILTKTEHQNRKVKVIATTELTKQLQDKYVAVNARHFNAGQLDQEHSSVNVKDVLAVYE